MGKLGKQLNEQKEKQGDGSRGAALARPGVPDRDQGVKRLPVAHRMEVLQGVRED